MRVARNAGPRPIAGFTLIELMITVAVMGILAAIAYPIYADYLTRGRLVDGTTKLGSFRADMEKYFMDNRTYLGAGAKGCGIVDRPAATSSDHFALKCERFAGPPETYLITATGANKMSPFFVLTVTEANVKSSAGPGGYWTNAACWSVRKDGTC